MLKVHLTNLPAPPLLDQLRARLDPAVSLSCSEIKSGADFEILIDGFAGDASLQASPRLRAVIVPWAGAPIEVVEQLKAFPNLTLHNLPYNAASTAETALALLLAAAKRILPHDRAFRRHLWSLPADSGPGSIVLEGRSALVLGYGRIGQRVAAGCRGLGMRARAICRTAHTGGSDPTFGPEALHDLLSETAALLICLPHTASTDHLIGSDELALLPDQALLVNVARGAIVTEQALYQALSTRRLFGAGLDVWYRYPSSEQRESRFPVPPSQFPFHELDNVVMSPHRAGWSEETEDARCTMLAESLNAAARGEPIPYRIDPAKGY